MESYSTLALAASGTALLWAIRNRSQNRVEVFAENKVSTPLDIAKNLESMENFRKYGHELVDWIANYRETVNDLPVLSQVSPGYLKAALPSEAPLDPESWEAVMKDVEQHIVPGLTNWESGKFYAYFKPHASTPSVLGEFLCASLNVMGFSWISSPACTELETLVMDWCAKLFGLPDVFLASPANLKTGGGGVIQGSAGESVIVALIAARDRALSALPAEDQDAASTRLVVYASDQAHSIVEKACLVLRMKHFRTIPAARADNFSMRPQLLQAAIAEDLAAGLLPMFLCATSGSTSSCAVDPLPELAKVCQAHNLWMHVDSAYAGSYTVCPEFRYMFKGIEGADSLAINAHKKLLVNFDCCMMWVKEKQHLTNALSLTPAYLRNTNSDAGAVIDYKDWQLPLGRRFRSLKLWMVLRMFGVSGLRAHIRNGVTLASDLEGWMTAHPLFHIYVPRAFALVCFTIAGADDAENDAFKEAVNATGDAFIISTELEGQKVLRVAVGGVEHTRADIEALWNILQQEAATIVAARGGKSK